MVSDFFVYLHMTATFLFLAFFVEGLLQYDPSWITTVIGFVSLLVVFIFFLNWCDEEQKELLSQIRSTIETRDVKQFRKLALGNRFLWGFVWREVFRISVYHSFLEGMRLTYRMPGVDIIVYDNGCLQSFMENKYEEGLRTLLRMPEMRFGEESHLIDFAPDKTWICRVLYESEILLA